jgi:hypothetical protein
VLRGRAKFQKHRKVEGDLEIAPRAPDDARLRQWIDESRAVLPKLRAIVQNGRPGLDPLHAAVEHLRRRVEALEDELDRFRVARGSRVGLLASAPRSRRPSSVGARR